MFDNRLLAILRAAAVHIKRKQILYNTASDIIQIFIVITQTGTMLSRITTALTKRLVSVSPSLHATEDAVTIWLGEFFESRGFDVLFDIDELRANTIGNTDVRNYQIGRFVLEAKDEMVCFLFCLNPNEPNPLEVKT